MPENIATKPCDSGFEILVKRYEDNGFFKKVKNTKLITFKLKVDIYKFIKLLYTRLV
ncbi:hypothetical protein M918_08945 [Clostridium sp. BL8]|nr:hypothetical protein M918_08945 [Clostridium sp. BL8]